MNNSEQLKVDADNFITTLTKLEAGELSVLRKYTGKSLRNSTGAALLFYSIVPKNNSYTRESAYWIIATLFASSKRKTIDSRQNLGALCQNVVKSMPTIKTHLRILLTCDVDKLHIKMRGITKLLESKNQIIDWKQLCFDLIRWDYNNKPAQNEWAKSFVNNNKGS